jgi:hypothetical protein
MNRKLVKRTTFLSYKYAGKKEFMLIISTFIVKFPNEQSTQQAVGNFNKLYEETGSELKIKICYG